MPWELIDHTGDIGIRVAAASLEEIFALSGEAMFSVLVETAGPPPAASEEFPVRGAEPAGELRDFLGELLYRFSAERRVYGPFTPLRDGIRAGAEPFSAGRHALRTELKAVTYHQLEVTRENDGWKAQVIFDV